MVQSQWSNDDMRPKRPTRGEGGVWGGVDGSVEACGLGWGGERGYCILAITGCCAFRVPSRYVRTQADSLNDISEACKGYQGKNC